MSREIKFRAWDNVEKRMVVPRGISFTDHEIYIDNKTGSADERLLLEVELMQYVGLDDKNGTPIYEGDIVKESPDGIMYYTRVVEYSGHGFCLSKLASFLQHEVDWSELEVIGNVYEHPELLERKV
jgi:uncharacterized phage protein (TIGR01671 family)